MKLWDLFDIYSKGIEAGGPGSGCNGPNCGRPPGHTGPHGKAKVGGKFSKQEKLYMRQKGMLQSLHGKPKPFPSTLITKRNTLSTGTLKIKIPGKRGFVTAKFTELRPVGKNQLTQGTGRWSAAPPDKPHPDIGRFHLSMKVEIPEENRKFWAYETLKSQEGHGTTVFVNKERTSANSSRVMLQEVERDRFSEILSTKNVEIKSGRQAKSFLKFRYGLDMVWTG